MAKTDLSGLTLDELNALIDEATKLRDQKVEEKRSALLKELQALDAISAPKGPRERQRAAPQAVYRGPNGEEWSGRGGIPRSFKALGVETKEQMEKYRIKG